MSRTNNKPPTTSDQQPATNNNFRFDPFLFIILILRKKYYFLIPSVAITIIAICIGSYNYLTSPVYKYSELFFSLTFKGINEDLYPNKTKFNEEDIISTPILQKVYDNYNLKNFYNNFSAFKRSISIQRYNPKLAFLNYEFKAKLGSRDISSARRYELEKEFFRQTAIITAKPQFIITATSSGAQKYNIPNSIIGKAVYGILKEWLNMATQKQGVSKYDISLMSKPMGSYIISETDYFNGTDYLRKMYDTLIEELDQIKYLPNINHLTVSVDNNKYNLKDLTHKLEYIKSYMLTPLLNKLETKPIYKNKNNTINYIQEMLENLKVKAGSLKEEKASYENMLINHIVSSHEQLTKINKEEITLKKDLQFYTDFLQKYKKSSNSSFSKKEVAEIVNKQQSIFQAENSMINSIYDFYLKASKYNLENNSSFYKINGFSSYNVSKVKLKFVVTVTAVIWLIIEVILLLIIIMTIFLNEIFKHTVQKEKE
ncbi:MAG: hypothetical protein GY756_08375 [bacterium]|nr:hypothetical protein [bacterium]